MADIQDVVQANPMHCVEGQSPVEEPVPGSGKLKPGYLQE